MRRPVPIQAEDLAPGATVGKALLALNNTHHLELSWLDAGRFRSLSGRAFAAWRVGAGEAMLLAFDQEAEYDSPNFLWFRSRFERFVYVDRVVVAAQARGRGVARNLYRALFAAAWRAGHGRVTCEVNAEPPNRASDAFHAALGFAMAGEGMLADRGKRVRYMVRALTAADNA